MSQVEAWRSRRNTHNAQTNWHFTTAGDGVKLISLEPLLWEIEAPT